MKDGYHCPKCGAYTETSNYREGTDWYSGGITANWEYSCNKCGSKGTDGW